MNYENLHVKQPTVMPSLIWPALVLLIAVLLFLF
jgi:hypothetical protein